eukprot:6210136-Pleurochrysis_carterae.AAC.2
MQHVRTSERAADALAAVQIVEARLAKAPRRRPQLGFKKLRYTFENSIDRYLPRLSPKQWLTDLL